MKRDKENRKPAFVKRSALVVGEDYAQLLANLKERYRKSRIKAAVKVNTAMLEFYWDMGREISRLKADAKWGTAFFDCLSLDLKTEFSGQTGFSSANIRYTYRWYNFYIQGFTILQRVVEEFNKQSSSTILHHVNKELAEKNNEEIRQQVVDEFQMPADFGLVPWGHHIDIFTQCKSIEEAVFYIEDPTIGLLVCKSKDDTVVEWSFIGMNQPLGVAEYKLRNEMERISKMLPTELEMKKIIDTYPLPDKKE